MLSLPRFLPLSALRVNHLPSSLPCLAVIRLKPVLRRLPAVLELPVRAFRDNRDARIFAFLFSLRHVNWAPHKLGRVAMVELAYVTSCCARQGDGVRALGDVLLNDVIRNIPFTEPRHQAGPAGHNRVAHTRVGWAGFFEQLPRLDVADGLRDAILGDALRWCGEGGG